MWFEKLTGFREEDADNVRANLSLEGQTLVSKANGRRLQAGTLEVISLGELRQRVLKTAPRAKPIKLREVVADVKELHRDPANAGATFQVASQFNLLEMVGPSITPDHGIDGYELDATQGPACAIACGAGTIYRNYFVPVGEERGQTASRQLDCLADLGEALGNQRGRLWTMQNGYALASEAGLREITGRLQSASDDERDKLRQLLRIGVHRDTEVTIGNAGHTVTQVYASALPVSYSNCSPHLWQAFAQLVLDAAYEATFATAALQAARGGNAALFLTLLGGGAFGNEMEWILSALERAVGLYGESGLDVAVVSYGRPRAELRGILG